MFQQQRYQQRQQQQQQQRPNLQDLAFPGDATSRAMYYQKRPPTGSDLKQEVPQYDPSYRLPLIREAVLCLGFFQDNLALPSIN
ncbi:hypothetical protein Taro_042649 [Colocasia esculenta]|uniref:Uncharacterized protein n=1 Tax=Colocasia esculenta TaxID=4460 RepID=A0A843WHE8_COLES|nr:hypothetical protein [Colocasia esculenta]